MLRKIAVKLLVKEQSLIEEKNIDSASLYEKYIEKFEKYDEKSIDKLIGQFSFRPVFSICIPVFNVPSKYLNYCIKSIFNQSYPHWELCLADDCSTNTDTIEALKSLENSDPRIKIVWRKSNGHISKATNSALEIATGDFISLMDNDDTIAKHALYEFALLLNKDPSIDMIYSDEDKITVDGDRYEPFFKPDWSPEALEGCMYTAHFACYRAEITKEIGGFRTECDGAQDYDFVLRFTERTQNIRHIPKILYHWRAIPGSTAASMDEKEYTIGRALTALQDRVNRVAGAGTVKAGLYAGSFDVRYSLAKEPLVSVIIPTASGTAQVRGEEVLLIENIVKKLKNNQNYQNLEIIIVDNGDFPAKLQKLPDFLDVKVVSFLETDFNIATKMNMGAAASNGDYLLFLNDDIDPIAPDWVETLLQYAMREGVGAVGAKLRYENGHLQHVGVGFWQGLPDHIYSGYHPDFPGYFFSCVATRNYSAVTGAVMMTSAELFRSVDGFDEALAINYNDIDYCLKVREKGKRIVFAAAAELYHYESVSRERSVAESEIEYFKSKWHDFIAYDPYYNNEIFEDHPPCFQLRDC